jgi:tetratricopeptide (TPR) repeat protein
LSDASQSSAQVFFLPLAIPDPRGFDTVDSGVLSRRIPHFLELLLNHGEPGPVDTLEMHTDPDEGPVRWVTLDEPPDSEEAFAHLQEHLTPRAVINGSIAAEHDGLRVELAVHLAEDRRTGISTVVRGVLALADPVPALCGLADRLARVLGLPQPMSPTGLLTSQGEAFFKFLQGLDGAVLLNSDLPVERSDDAQELMRPFAEALRLDPGFGLALRTVQQVMAAALYSRCIGKAECMAVLDRCLHAAPGDADGCVAVAEHLAGIGDDARARAWLVHATHLDPPPPRGLEDLGIMLANSGDTGAARELWMQGVAIDGHPDFFAHLARLAFAEDQVDEAWDKALRGLRRIYERAVRAAEWQEGAGAGALLRCLVEHLPRRPAPADVVEAITDLVGLLGEAHDRLELSRCLIVIDRRDAARSECEASLGSGLPDDLRDQALEVLLVLDVPDFHKRFRDAIERVVAGRDLQGAIRELDAVRDAQPSFWPAWFFIGLARRRLGEVDAALDLMAEVLRLRPEQADALVEMAQLFDGRGNAKRALECIEQAIAVRGEDATLLAQRALFLYHLDRCDEALGTIERALAEERDPDYEQLRDVLKSKLV